MTLIEDARELSNVTIETLTRSGTIVCAVCFKRPHGARCPVLSLPRIVAALEIADDIAAHPPRYTAEYEDGYHWVLACCVRRQDRGHDSACALQALARVLSSEEATNA